MGTRANVILCGAAGSEGPMTVLYRHYDADPAVGGMELAAVLQSRKQWTQASLSAALVATGNFKPADQIFADIEHVYYVTIKNRHISQVLHSDAPMRAGVCKAYTLDEFQAMCADLVLYGSRLGPLGYRY